EGIDTDETGVGIESDGAVGIDGGGAVGGLGDDFDRGGIEGACGAVVGEDGNIHGSVDDCGGGIVGGGDIGTGGGDDDGDDRRWGDDVAIVGDGVAEGFGADESDGGGVGEKPGCGIDLHGTALVGRLGDCDGGGIEGASFIDVVLQDVDLGALAGDCLGAVGIGDGTDGTIGYGEGHGRGLGGDTVAVLDIVGERFGAGETGQGSIGDIAGGGIDGSGPTVTGRGDDHQRTGEDGAGGIGVVGQQIDDDGFPGDGGEGIGIADRSGGGNGDGDDCGRGGDAVAVYHGVREGFDTDVTGGGSVGDVAVGIDGCGTTLIGGRGDGDGCGNESSAGVGVVGQDVQIRG